MITPAEAEKIIVDSIVPFHREDCPLTDAHGRILRADLTADRDLPPYDRVTLDGYAVRAASLAAGERRFQIEAVQSAGMRPYKLSERPDACVEAMTGAVLPTGADCVVPYEDAVRNGAAVLVVEEAGQFEAGHAIHRCGTDARAGDVMVRAGVRLTGREIAIAAACGRTVVTVAQMPKIAVVATGDELVEVEMAVAAHQVRRSNDHALRAALIAAGFTNVGRYHLRDVPHEIEHMLWHIIAEHDVVIIIGGVSKGKFDYIPAELERQDVKKRFHGVAQRPGKPMWFGVSPRHTLVFALPGNPVSCYTCLHRYILPALAYASGLEIRPVLNVALNEVVTFKPTLTYFLPVTLSTGSDARLMARPAATNTSGDFAGLVGTDGFVELPAEPFEFPAGTIARFWKWM